MLQQAETLKKIQKKGKVMRIGLAVFLILALLASSIFYASALTVFYTPIPSYGQINYAKEAFFTQLQQVHVGKGIGAVVSGSHTRDNIWFSRMQLFAEIDNTATDPMDVLVPNGAWYTSGGNYYSEGGVDYEHLLRNLAYCFDREMVAAMALWITNIDPLDARLNWDMYGYEDPDVAPKLPMANVAGYTTFLTALNNWILENYPNNKNAFVLWEPCWEFNLYPWTNWGGAGGNRLWALYPQYYEDAMTIIRSVLDTLPNRRIYLISHIVPWHAASWQERGKLRITGDNIGYLRGIQKADYLTISLYVNRDNWIEQGTAYVDWAFENVVKQIALDPDIGVYGCEFLGTSEYNIDPMSVGSPPGYLTFIEYSFNTIVPRYHEYLRMFGWWLPFNSAEEIATWNYWSSQYDGWTP